jgi:hypothetical protein
MQFGNNFSVFHILGRGVSLLILYVGEYDIYPPPHMVVLAEGAYLWSSLVGEMWGLTLVTFTYLLALASRCLVLMYNVAICYPCT